MDDEDCKESATTRLDWTVRGLKQLLEASKGETKSRATKSLKFGGGRWQVLFYPNSGTDGGQYISLYLSCEPTADENDHAVNGKWVRDGLYRFSFELRSVSGAALCNSKEAVDHSFSWKTANWGWAQFARRDAVYYHQNGVRTSDSFLVTCVISSARTVPAKTSLEQYRSVPRDLLQVIGSLLDDPIYSDVVFVFPSRTQGCPPRKINAARSILNRVEYFKSMFSSGFAESSFQLLISPSTTMNENRRESVPELIRQSDDSDDSEEMCGSISRGVEQEIEPRTSTEDMQSADGTGAEIDFALAMTSPTLAEISNSLDVGQAIEIDTDMAQAGTTEQEDRAVVPKLVHPSSPQSRTSQMEQEAGPAKTVVIVKDVAYATYRAILYYIYTDKIIFAPLSSSFLSPAPQSGLHCFQAQNPQVFSEGQNMIPPVPSRLSSVAEISNPEQNTRRTWLEDWEKHNRGQVRPCSAKAVYRVADKLDMTDLKARAFQHIVDSMTVANVPYELFSKFSATFEEVRKVELGFFLKHWAEIRISPAMKDIWQQIRVGRHPGFEEVWPLIAMNLEFKPHSGDLNSSQGSS